MNNFQNLFDSRAQYDFGMNSNQPNYQILSGNQLYYYIFDFNPNNVLSNERSSCIQCFMAPTQNITAMQSYPSYIPLQNSQNEEGEQPNPVILRDGVSPKKNSINRSGKNVKVEKKSKRDPDYKPKKNKTSKKISQISGRNSCSNIYRAFIKLISSRAYKKILEQNFQKIDEIIKDGLQLSDFMENTISRLPAFTNYVNKSQFQSFYVGNEPSKRIFRILFQYFMRSNSQCHILTVLYKQKMKRQSINQFLKTVRQINSSLNTQNGIPTQ